jgi:hypothetical protein
MPYVLTDDQHRGLVLGLSQLARSASSLLEGVLSLPPAIREEAPPLARKPGRPKKEKADAPEHAQS